jgi:hypothetical protein
MAVSLHRAPRSMVKREFLAGKSTSRGARLPYAGTGLAGSLAFLLLLLLAFFRTDASAATSASPGALPLTPAPLAGGQVSRTYWVQVLTHIADPVLIALSQNKLKATMPVVPVDRKAVSHLEAVGRLLSGMAPWLELGPDDSPEGRARARYIDLAAKSIANAVDPGAPDFLNFSHGQQPLVDAAFLAHALLRAPRQLWGNLNEPQRTNLVAALKSTRGIKPGENNWLLFSAMIEAGLWQLTGSCEIEPIRYAVTKHLEWYKGDGVYGDGPRFHWDYYNSYVIQPMLLDVLRVCREKGDPLGTNYGVVLERARRYAAVQERLISPEGTFPVIGRSSAYRFGAFQLLAQVALLHQLPPSSRPAAVRCALTAVIRNMIEAPGTFDQNGWLRIGAVGFQPSIGEGYISTGSLYLCATGLLALGLPANDPFWTDPDAPWTQKAIWARQDVPADHAIAR